MEGLESTPTLCTNTKMMKKKLMVVATESHGHMNKIWPSSPSFSSLQ